MKYLSFIVILIGSLTRLSFSQKINSSYEKYSYHVVGLIGNKPQSGGSGFFIKKDSDYYLVSAWHCFSFRDYLTEDSEDSTDIQINNIAVYRNISDIDNDNYLRINTFPNLSKINIYSEVRLNDTLLDISSIKVDRSNTFDFDYLDLDSCTDKSLFNLGDSVFYFGFPIINGKQEDKAQYFEGSCFEKPNTRKEFVIKILGYTGCSGSPLFIIKKGRILLKGVLFYALKDKTGKAYFCKAVDINNLIYSLKK